MRVALKLVLISAYALWLSACSTVQRLGAANDVHALLISIRDNDRVAFDAHVDREALKREIEARVGDQIAHSKKAESLGDLRSILAPALAKYAGDTLIQPKVFRQVADFYGYKPDKPIPNAVVIAGALKTMPDGRVCATAKKNGPCVLIFSHTGGAWRLSGFQGDMSMLRIKL